MLLLLFEGPNVQTVLLDAIGHELPNPSDPSIGKYIRGAYGFCVRDEDTGHVVDFEPALVTAHTQAANHRYLKMFSKYAETDAGTLIEPDQWEECGMVMLKPDLFTKPSSRPGHIMDLLSSTGLRLVSTRLFSMSINQAEDFYGFLRPIFAKKLAPKVDSILRHELKDAFKFDVTNPEFEVMTSLLKHNYAQAEVDNIIHYITGIYPHNGMSEADKRRRGPAKLLALLYTGPNAIETIRTKLGATDPKGAASGTIRSDFGRDIMRNGAHASDSLESLHRERMIVGFHQTRRERASRMDKENARPSTVKTIIDVWLGDKEVLMEEEEMPDQAKDFALPWADHSNPSFRN